MILVFIGQTFIEGFTDYLLLDERAYLEIWRFLTAVFIHGGLGHLLFNLFALALFGSILEVFVGWRRFLLIFLVTGILANLISVNFYDSSLGASGAIFGVIGALIIIRPLMMVWAFGVPMPIFIAGIIWIAGDLIGAYAYLSSAPLNNTGNIAHLMGVLFGIIFGFLFKTKNNAKRSPNLRIDEPSFRQWEDRNL